MITVEKLSGQSGRNPDNTGCGGDSRHGVECNSAATPTADDPASKPNRNVAAADFSRRQLGVMLGLCVAALSIAAYLAWTTFQSTGVFGCGGGVFDCGHVLNSQWSKFLGIPVSVPAFMMYAACVAALLCCLSNARLRIRQSALRLLTVGGLAAGLAAIWFIGLQVLAIGHLCPWCLAAHSCGLILCGIVLWKRPLGGSETTKLAAISVAGIAVLIGGQVTAEPPPTFVEERFDAGLIAAADGDLLIEVAAPGSEYHTVNRGTGLDGDVFAPPDVFAAPDVFAPPDVFAAPDAFAAPDVVEPPAEVSIPDGVPAVTPDGTPPEPTDVKAGLPAAASSIEALLLFAALSAVEPADNTADPVSQTGDGSSRNAVAATGADADPQTDSSSPCEIDEQPAGTPATRLVSQQQAERRLVVFSPQKKVLDIRQWPLIGNPDARYVFVEMFDYTCPHCRNSHAAVDGAFQRYGDDLAVIVLPVPLHPSCNSTVTSASAEHADACELARIAVAVWRVDAVKFRDFHAWLLTGGRNRTAHEARLHAAQLLGQDAINAELARPTAGQYVARHVELYRAIGAGSVPKMMFPGTTLTGEMTSPTTLCNVIERELGTR